MSWIQKLLDDTDDAETPRAYIYWSGISIISAIISPNVYMNCGGVYRVAPNTFVIMIGESGLGKGLPSLMAKKLVTMVGSTRVISGANTIQSISQRLANSETDEKTGVPKWKDARGFIVSGEFINLLEEDKKALTTLTEWYDTHWMEDWVKSTKNSGTDKLEKLCVTLYTGSTPEHFQQAVSEANIKGGFGGRLLTVYEEKQYKINPLDDTDIEKHLPWDDWVIHLHKIKELTGGFSWENEKTRLFWREWYHSIKSKRDKIKDPTGAINRITDNVRKVAMCLSLARQTKELVISYDDLNEAIIKCMSLTTDSRRLTGGSGESTIGKQVHFVTQILYRAAIDGERITKSRLLFNYYGHFDSFELDRIISTLEMARICRSLPIQGPPADVQLEMLPECVEQLKNYQKMME